MGKKLDQVVSVGTTIGALVGLWDRLSAWHRKRREERAEARRIAAYNKQLRAIHEKQRADDIAAIKRGVTRCAKKPECKRPRGHAGDCGPGLVPWKAPKKP